MKKFSQRVHLRMYTSISTYAIFSKDVHGVGKSSLMFVSNRGQGLYSIIQTFTLLQNFLFV